MLFERGYENFLYLHHLDLLVWIPTYADELDITQRANFSQTKPLGAPNDIYSFGGSGPRTVQRQILLDRDMMQIMGAQGLGGSGDPIGGGGNQASVSYSGYDVEGNQYTLTVTDPGKAAYSPKAGLLY